MFYVKFYIYEAIQFFNLKNFTCIRLMIYMYYFSVYYLIKRTVITNATKFLH